MIDVVFRLDPDKAPSRQAPRDAAQARAVLEAGNEAFANLYRDPEHDRRHIIPLDSRALGLSDVAGRAPEQTPFAVVLGCADARVPVDLIFHRAVNDLFVIRVAGNVLGNECVGSAEYAIAHLESVRLLVVLGHSSCGAVTTAVDAYLHPAQYLALASTQGLRSIVDHVLLSVRAADIGLEETFGNSVREIAPYRDILIETAVVINAALNAMTIQRELKRDVVFGVYNLESRRVSVPRAGHDQEFGLREPPADFEELRKLGREVAGSAFVKAFVDAAS